MQLRRLKVERFRGLKHFVWHPGPGVNCLTGPGDVGKSTVLDAIATLLSPAPGQIASEHDYFDGVVSDGFVIEALLGKLDDNALSAWSVAPLWTWNAETRSVQADPDPEGEAVLCLRARGTEDLGIEHVIVDPSEGETALAASKRQLFGLATMGSAITAYRELRMSRGSLLARNVERDQLRGLATEALQASRDSFTLPDEVQERVKEVSRAFEAVAPGTGELTLAMLSPRGQNLLGMIALFAKARTEPIPLANAGRGTQQLALFTLASLLIGGIPLFVVDELESGLEPFRQRDLIARIRRAIGSDGQAFLTTHSPAAIGEMTITELHRIDAAESGASDASPYPAALQDVKQADPEALLSRLPVLVEGRTEMGLLECLLGERANGMGTSLGALGVRLVDGGGQPKVFAASAAFRGMGLRCGAFLDSENEWGGKRKELEADDLVAFGTYSSGRCFEAAIAAELSISDLDDLIALPDLDGRDLSDGRYQQLNESAGEQSRHRLAELVSEFGEQRCRDLFAEAANRRSWFKTTEHGFAVGRFLLERHPGSQIVRDVTRFWEAAAALIADQMPAATRS